MRRLVLVAAAAVLFSTGCGGIISSVFIVQGTVALAGARAANAENLATYEYVSAEAYLRKAREAHSYSDFEHSLRFARLAAERAGTARKKALDANKPLDPNAVPPVDPMAPEPQPGMTPPPQGAPGSAPPPAATPQAQPAPRPPVIIQIVPEPQPAPAPNAPPPPAATP